MTTYLLGAIVRLWRKITKSGIEEMPAQHQVDRDRAAYEAEIAKAEREHLSAADEAEIAAFEAFVNTGELPNLAFDADPLGAPIPDGYVVEAEALFNDLFANMLSAFTWTAAPGTTVALSSVPVFNVPEPDPIALETPTGVFPKDWLERAMAGGAR